MSVIYSKKLTALGGEIFNIEKFSSSSEVVQLGNNRKITDSQFDDKRKDVHSDPHWYGKNVSSWADVENLMRTGYQPVVERLKAADSNLRGDTVKRIQFKNSIVGFAPVVPLYLQGVPNCMIDMTMKKIKCKVLSVYYDMTVNCGTDAADLERAGCEMLGAILELEKQGYRFNLYCVQSYQRKGEGGDVMCVKVKDSNTPLDLKRISFCIAHPAFFRAVGFDWYARFPQGKYRWGYGRSMYHDYQEKQIEKAFEEMFGEKCVVFQASNAVHKDRKQFKEVLENAGQNKS